MKKYLPPREAIACFILCAIMLCLHAQETVDLSQATITPRVDTSKIFVVDSPNRFAFMVTTYNRVFIGTWLEIRGKEVDHAQSVTMQDNPIFAPGEVRIVVKNEPVVMKNVDGTWEITFKEGKP